MPASPSWRRSAWMRLQPFKEMDALQADVLDGSHWIRRINIGVAAFGIVTGVTLQAVLIANKFQWDIDNRVVMAVLISMLMAALLYAWRSRA